MLQNSNPATIQPKVVVIRRSTHNGFGFTLRHFIAYPPEDDPSWPKEATESPYHHNQQQTQSQPQSQPVKAMETIFIKEVVPSGPAFYANLQTGDRVLMVNNKPIAGIAYSTIVSMIKQTPAVLTLHVVPKECDVLQMHYTSIAHTPESNRLNATIPLTKSVNSVSSATAVPPTVISYPSGSRSGSITSTASSNLRQFLVSGNNGPSCSGSEYREMATNSAMLLRSDAGLARTQPSNLTVLPQPARQQQQHQQQQQLHHASASFYAANIPGVPLANAVVDNSDIMVRLRESIKQKEEFLKSPLPHAPQSAAASYSSQQHFFPHTPPSGSPQLSAISTSTTSVGSSAAGHSAYRARGQVRTIVKQPLSATSSSSSSTRELLPGSSYGMQNSYTKNFVSNYALEGRETVGLPAEHIGSRTTFNNLPASSQQKISSQFGNNGNNSSYSGHVTSLRDKYSKDFDYLETLQETGVTNKVFERKLVSHMSKGFDPFKQLSINTSALVETGNATATSNAAALMRKPGVLYESLQNHPLHQLQQLQQQQHPQHHQSNQLPGRACVASSASSSGHNIVIDGQSSSNRMEIHKASLAAATVENPQSSKHINNKSEEKTTTQQQQQQEQLGNIAENTSSSDMISYKSKATDNITRRLMPAASLDDGKPMRRISYLRATNNENEYQTPAEVLSTTTAPATAAASAILKASKERCSLEDDSDPTYDVVAGDCEPLTEFNSGVAGASGALDIAAKAAAATATACTLSGNSGRRTSISSEIRNSAHVVDGVAATSTEVNVKLDTKDGSSELETFETEMEIKSTCINGKRMSEYRSWKPVKIEIRGDMLKIFSSRTSKPDSNVIEIDIRNFKIFDESVEKKKYIFRMQSKPTAHIATLGNEMNLDDVHTEKSSTSASGTGAGAFILCDHPQQLQQQPHTEILFKAKSINELRRIFGLLQWKNSFIYDDSDLQGKQLAEPQKTAATTSLPTATYCDDIVQQQQLHPPPDYSPLSSTSRGELEVSDSISPVMKARKSSSHKNIPDKDLGSPKAKNWKDLIFRRGGSSHSSADVSPSNLSSAAKTTGSIGVPLKSCPMSKSNEYVPNIVEVCTNIVETKGLSVVGIYRIPGNKAAISELSEQVNKSDFSWERVASDVRWEDVNVVSSLLKLFIRSLPDALLPSSFYINFIEADKKTGLVRLKELKYLLASLPRYSYETMKHLIRHLNRVSKNCGVNLMEPKNLAIIFGPSIIRTPNDTLEIAVKDMKHQCRIVELLVSQYDYFFENGNTPDIADVSGNVSSSLSSDTAAATVAQAQENQTNMLLHNVSKIERLTERETSSRTSRFIPQLRRRTHSKRSAVSSDTYSGESVLSLDYGSKSSSQAGGGGGGSSSGSSSTNATINLTKKERFLSSAIRVHHRKASLDEKDSGSASGSGSGGSLKKEQQRSSVDISILLTDDESSNSRNSDTGSMSLNAVTDTLDSKLRNLRSGSESNDEENTSPDFPKNRRHTLGQPLHLHSENIPYADESPERHFHNTHPLDLVVPLNPLTLSRSCTNTNTIGNGGNCGGVVRMAQEFAEREKEQRKMLATHSHSPYKSHKLQHSATAPINSSSNAAANTSSGSMLSPPSASTPTAVVTVKASSAGGVAVASARNSYTGKNLRFSSSVYEQCCSEDDSEGSTTSDPKESLVITSPSFFLDRYNKKRRDHRLFRSASFNCRNYTTRHGSNVAGSGGVAAPVGAGLTKDEKTDMNLTKKRQIQNKQNRSIKRRHTVGGPHDYSSTTPLGGAGAGSCQNHNCKSSSTSATTIIRRIPLSSANGNITNNNNNNNINNNSSPSNGNGSSSNGNSSSDGNSGGASTTVAVAGDHVLEVGIRIKNINRSRY